MSVSNSLSESWADAEAETPMGDGRSDSEDTLSNLSFDNDILDDPGVIGPADVVVVENGAAKRPGVLDVGGESAGGGGDQRQSGVQSGGQSVNVRVQINDYEMDDEESLPPGAEYKPPTVDFPTSPSQLKISQGPSYMPTEDAGLISEDDSSVNSYHAHLGLNGNVRLTKREGEEFSPEQQQQEKEEEEEEESKSKPYLHLPPNPYELSSCSTDIEPESLLLEDTDGFDDYIEDFFNPLSNEPVMQRATSFRRKVQKQLEEAVVEKSIKVINNFDAMLSRYEEEEEDNLSDKSNSLINRGGINAIKKNNMMTPTTTTTITPDCKKCHGFTPMCSDCRHKCLPRSNFDLTDHPRNGMTNSYGIQKSVVNSTPSTNGDDSSNTTDNNKLVAAFKDNNKLSQVIRVLNFLEDQEDCLSEPQSLLDIDAICKAHAPNLMNSMEPLSSFTQIHLHNPDDESSNYFLPKETLNKIQSVFESSNFTNFYTLSGELKHILSPSEIEEIVANKEHLAAFLNPDVMAALSMSLVNESSLPVIGLNNNNNSSNNNNMNKSDEESKSLDIQNNILNKSGLHHKSQDNLPILIAKEDDTMMNNCFSSATSISNGYNSKESSLTDVSDQNELDELQSKHNNKNNKDKYGSDGEEKDTDHDVSPSNGIVTLSSQQQQQQESQQQRNGDDSEGSFQRRSSVTNSFRRKIALGELVTSGDLPQKYVEDETYMTPPPTKTKQDSTCWKSLESLDDLDVEDGIESRHESENGEEETPKMFLVRRDSKRFNKEDASRVIQGLFVESKSMNGTLKRLKVPLNIADDDDLDDTKETIGDHDLTAVKSPRSHKKRISVDDHILSIASEMTDIDDSDITQSDVFHSIINSVRDEDRTIRSDDGDDEDITLDLDTPDDMEESILEQLESIATTPVDRERIPELTAAEELEDERCWKSFRVGANDIQIDLKAIQPYRRVLSHGGYADAERKVAIILFSGCFLPDRSRKEYSYLLDHLFLYVLSSLEELIVEDYILVYLHGATPKSCMPTFSWLKRCYQLIDRRLRKNLKGLYLVHPTFWLKTVVALTKPFVSTKFSRKVQFVNTLADLCLVIPTEHLVIPDRVLHYDFELKVDELRKQNLLS